MRAGDRCIVHAGTYRETVTPANSGTEEAPIVFEAAKGERVILSGTEPLAFRDGAASMPWRFNADFQSDQLFAGGEMMHLLRWPKNTGTLVRPTDAKVVEATDAGGDRILFKVEPRFDEPDGRWNGAEVWVNLSHNGHDGQGQTGRVVATSRADGTITVSGIDKRSWNDGKYNPDQPWGIGKGTELHLFNPTQAGLDATGGPPAALAPNEWWRNETTVFARPSGPVEAKRRSYAFDLTDRSHVVVRGFELFGTSITTDRDAARRGKSFAGSRDITLDRLTGKYLTHFTDMSGQYQMQWLQKSGIILSGIGHTLSNCDLRYAAGPLVSVIGSNNRVIDNVLRDGNYSVSEAGVLDLLVRS
jgi:hypothetical protein